MTVTYTNLKITSSGGGGGFYSFVREASVSDDNVSGASSITANFNNVFLIHTTNIQKDFVFLPL